MLLPFSLRNFFSKLQPFTKPSTTVAADRTVGTGTNSHRPEVSKGSVGQAEDEVRVPTTPTPPTPPQQLVESPVQSPTPTPPSSPPVPNMSAVADTIKNTPAGGAASGATDALDAQDPSKMTKEQLDVFKQQQQTKGQQQEAKKSEGSLKISISLDLDVEVHLTARIKGDIVIGLL